jgi:Large polyvalent protein associated domain 29
MTRYISCVETAELIRVELKKNFPGIKFSVKSRSYANGASIDVYWNDGPGRPSVERITRKFQGSSFDGMTDSKSYHHSELDGEEVSFGADSVSCSRSMSRGFVEAILAQFLIQSGYNGPKIYITGTVSCNINMSALSYYEAQELSDLLHHTDAREVHNAYTAQQAREEKERDEWVARLARRAREAKEAAEEAKREEVRRQQEQARAKARQEQEERRQREQATRRINAFRTREDALARLGLRSNATPAQVKHAFYAQVKAASDGRGGYTSDMDLLTQAKEKALKG